MKKVLVTGGAGFIGSHLVDALIADGYAVRVLDSLTPPTHNRKLPDWFNKKAEFVRGDVRRKKDWERALRGVDYVYHLAAYMDYHLDFSTYVDTNTRSIALLYELIVEKQLPVKKVVMASSQSLYGEGKYRCVRHGVVYPEARATAQLERHEWEPRCPTGGEAIVLLPEREDDELRPRIPYGISKMAAEQMALTLGRIYHIPTVALRYSIVQGSRQSFRHFYSGALRDFSVRALYGLPIEMQEDARQIRDFVNVHDVVDAHLVVLKDTRADGEVFNVGSGRKTRVMDLARNVANIAGTPFRPVVKGVFRINAPRHSVMDISKLKKLGWKPKMALADSIKEYIDWVRQYPEARAYLKKTYRDMAKARIIKT